MRSVVKKSMVASGMVLATLLITGCSSTSSTGAAAMNSPRPTEVIDQKGHVHYVYQPGSQAQSPYALTGNRPVGMKAIVDQKGHTHYVPVW